ncbi:UDP-N-acetylmuramoyl-tripeptide--D-alanyl-D-alanine ligase [Leptospira interrogans serovar Grippotyphosa str. 2006006986]|uniref:UDP-N-acetylmuramoyl-tripeptide--D-alanyl-D- alanine ligase n=1 Tax=Leptospira interrogans TaxID=173 RepID=UPI0002928190|nr:UDP-N-acetylmuramoyl-tripeptide--D-alanyl-D-alanine ligase [Leptospira interrogans]EKO85222.1 UDP-N-acetylmuramoyl-tripeptide--D-alanyl-D-alanine ligase [Leptospira interrogans serovar Grippotyphosa str. Andaman]EKP85211.1 UDP-N-acetylmuramoyl-tripeptide--D-alanyl-D-alanine ligase [Leptospira interrogans serovar Grippotyphosa str. 2006006986]
MKSNFYYDPETIRRVLGSTSETWYHKEPLITTITTSSTEAEENSLFVPLLGNRDGHEFIRDAISKGATYFLVEENHPIYKNLNLEEKSKAIPVKNTLTALGKLASFHRSRFDPIVIAVTGSSGKTTTKELLGNCLKNLEESALVVTEKNYNNEIGLPFTLFKISDQTRVVVCELGMNHKGEISRLSQIAKPDYAIITTIGTAHIEFLESQKNIAKAKGEIVEGLKKGGKLFYPNTGEYSKILKNKTRKHGNKLVLTKSDKIFSILQKKSSGFLLEYKNKKIQWNLPGEKLLENLSVAITCLEAIGTPQEWIQEGIHSFKSSNKRLDLQNGKYFVINDTYNANYESMISSLEVADQLADGKEFYAVLGDMKELGEYSKEFHKKLGKKCSEFQNLKGLYTFGTDSFWIQEEFVKRTSSPRFSEHFPGTQEGLSELIHKFLQTIPEGSIVLAKASRGIQLERFVEALPV